MALSSKEREKIIEEETLRYETRRNLHVKHCGQRRTFWPWVVFGGLAVWLLYSWIFCGGIFCTHEGGRCPMHGMGMGYGHHEMMGGQEEPKPQPGPGAAKPRLKAPKAPAAPQSAAPAANPAAPAQPAAPAAPAPAEAPKP